MRAGPIPLETSGYRHLDSRLLSLRRCNLAVRPRRLGSWHLATSGARESLRSCLASRAVTASPDNPSGSSNLTRRLFHTRSLGGDEFPSSDHLPEHRNADTSTVSSAAGKPESQSLPWREGVTDHTLVASTSGDENSGLVARHILEYSTKSPASTCATRSSSFRGCLDDNDDDMHQHNPHCLGTRAEGADATLASTPGRSLTLRSSSGRPHTVGSVGDLTACVSRWLEDNGAGLRHWLLTAFRTHEDAPVGAPLGPRDPPWNGSNDCTTLSSLPSTSLPAHDSAFAQSVTEVAAANRKVEAAEGVLPKGSWRSGARDSILGIGSHIGGAGGAAAGVRSGIPVRGDRSETAMPAGPAATSDFDDALFVLEPFSESDDDSHLRRASHGHEGPVGLGGVDTDSGGVSIAHHAAWQMSSATMQHSREQMLPLASDHTVGAMPVLSSDAEVTAREPVFQSLPDLARAGPQEALEVLGSEAEILTSGQLGTAAPAALLAAATTTMALTSSHGLQSHSTPLSSDLIAADPWIGENAIPPYGSTHAASQAAPRYFVALSPPPVRRTSTTCASGGGSSSNGSGSRRESSESLGSGEETDSVSGSQFRSGFGSMPTEVLTWELSHAADWRRLAVLVQLNAEQLDCIHVSAALVRLAKLHRCDAGALTVPIDEVGLAADAAAADSASDIGRSNSKSVSSSSGTRFARAWMKARARAMRAGGPDRAWLSAVKERRVWRTIAHEYPGGVRADRPRPSHLPLGSVKGRSIERVLQSDVARLIEFLISRIPGLMPLASYRTVSNMIWALGVLQPLIAPRLQCRSGGPVATVAGLRRVTATAAILAAKMRHFWHEAAPQSLALALWGLARLRVRPGSVWMTEFEFASGRLLTGFNARELSCCLWAFATLRLRPDALWLASVQGAVVTGFSNDVSPSVANLRAVATLLWAFAVLRVRLNDLTATTVLTTLNSRLQAENSHAGPQVLSMALWGCARLQLKPSSDLLAVWRRAASGPVLAAAPARAVSCMLWSLAQLRCAPPGSWLDEAAAALLVRAREGGLDRQSLCLAVGSLAQLDSRMSPQWIQNFTATAAPLVRKLDSSELGVVLHGLGRLVGGGASSNSSRSSNAPSRENVAADFLAAADSAAVAALAAASADDMAGIGGGLTALGAARSAGLHDAFVKQAFRIVRHGTLHLRHAAAYLEYLAASARPAARCPSANGSSSSSNDCNSNGGGGGADAGAGEVSAPKPCHDFMRTRVPANSKQPLPPPPAPPPPRRLILELLRVVLAAELDQYDVFDVGQALCAAGELGIIAVTPAARSAVTATAMNVCGHAPGARGVLRLLQGLYGLRVRPHRSWLNRVASQIGGRLRSLTGEELEQLLRLLGALQWRRSAAQVTSALAAARPTLTRREATVAAAAAGGAGTLPHQQQEDMSETPSALTLLLSAAQPSLAAAPIQHLLQLATALVAASTGPSTATITEKSVAVAAPLPSPPPLRNLEMPAGWMQAFESATAAKLSKVCVSGASLVELLACFVCLGHVPGSEWISAWYDSTARRFRGLHHTHLCMALHFQRRLGLRPPLAWLRSHAAALITAATGSGPSLPLPPIEVLAAVAELQRLGLDDAILAAGPSPPDAATAPPPAGLSGLVAMAAKQLHEEMLVAEPAAQLATLAALQAIADPRVVAPAPHTEGWAVGVLAMVHSVIAQRPIHQLMAGLRSMPSPSLRPPVHTGSVLGAAAAAHVNGSGGGDPAANPDASPEPIMILLASMARWGHAPDHRWLSGIARHVCRRAEAATTVGSVLPAADAARAVCCLATLGYVPDAAVSERLQQLLQPALAAGRLPPGLAAELCCAWATVRRRPPPAWWCAAEEGALAPSTLAQVPPSMLLRLPYSMAQLGHVPSYEWLACYLPHLQTALAAPTVSPVPHTAAAASASAVTINGNSTDGVGTSGSTRAVDLANLAWALGSAVHDGGYPPEVLSSSGVLQALLAATLPLLGAMGPGQLVLLVEGLARGRHRLPSAWVAAFVSQVSRQLPSCGPSDLVSVLYCLAFLDAHPPAPWLAAALQRTAQVLPPLLRSVEAYRADDLAWAVVRLDPTGALATPFLVLLGRQRSAAAVTAAAVAATSETLPPSARFLRVLSADGPGRARAAIVAADASSNGGNDADGNLEPKGIFGDAASRDRRWRRRHQMPEPLEGNAGGEAAAEVEAKVDTAYSPAAPPSEEAGASFEAATRPARVGNGSGRGRGRGYSGSTGILRSLRLLSSSSSC